MTQSPSEPNIPSPVIMLVLVSLLFWMPFWLVICLVGAVLDGILGYEFDGGIGEWASGGGGLTTALLISSALAVWAAVVVGQSAEVYPWGCPDSSCKPHRANVGKISMRWRCDQCRVTWEVRGDHWEDERKRQHQTRYEVKRCEKCHEGRALYVSHYANHDWTEECRSCGFRHVHHHFDLI